VLSQWWTGPNGKPVGWNTLRPFQFIEGGWVLALSLLFSAATIWLIRRRTA
jgi:hypothetical protein